MNLRINPVHCIRGQRIGSFRLELGSSNLLFNTPDSFQRFLSENSIRTDAGLKIFFTRSTDDSFLGILGYFLSLIAQDKGEQLKIYMPAPLMNFMYQNRYLYGHRCAKVAFGCFDDAQSILLLVYQYI